MIKAAFFDVDGTIVSFKDHKLIPSAIEAINKLKEKNIKVFVATGRALFQLDYILDNLKLDGLVTLNGCNSFIDSEEIFRAHLHKDDLYRLYEYLEKNNNPFSCNRDPASSLKAYLRQYVPSHSSGSPYRLTPPSHNPRMSNQSRLRRGLSLSPCYAF